MTSFTTKLGDDFLRIPKLTSDGKNWVIYKDRLALSVMARGLDGHLDGTAVQPTAPPAPALSSKPTEVETKALTEYKAELRDWMQKEAIVLQQIASTVPDSLYLRIKGKKTVKEAWDLLKNEFEKRSRMFTIDLRRRLQEMRFDEGGDVRVHFGAMRTMQEDLAALGDDISDSDFTAMLLGSLPKSYDTYLSAITATISVLEKDLNPNALVLSVNDEFDRHAVKTKYSKDKGNESIF